MTLPRANLKWEDMQVSDLLERIRNYSMPHGVFLRIGRLHVLCGPEWPSNSVLLNSARLP